MASRTPDRYCRNGLPAQEIPECDLSFARTARRKVEWQAGPDNAARTVTASRFRSRSGIPKAPTITVEKPRTTPVVERINAILATPPFWFGLRATVRKLESHRNNENERNSQDITHERLLWRTKNKNHAITSLIRQKSLAKIAEGHGVTVDRATTTPATSAPPKLRHRHHGNYIANHALRLVEVSSIAIPSAPKGAPRATGC